MPADNMPSTRTLRDLQQLTASDPTIRHLLDAPDYTDRNPAQRCLARRNGLTRSTYRSRLTSLARLLGAPNGDHCWLNWLAFDALRISALLNDLYEPTLTSEGVQRRRSPNTMNGYLATLKAVMREAFRMELITPNAWAEIEEIRRFRNDLPLSGRMVEDHEIMALEAAITASNQRHPARIARDMLLIRLGFFVGLRKHEYSALMLEDFNRATQELRITGKGGKVAALELPDTVIDALYEWLNYRGEKAGALFYRITKSGRLTEHPLSKEGVRHLFAQYQKRAGLKQLTSHDARRTFVSNLFDDPDIDPATARNLARHSSFDTTAGYDRRAGRKRRTILNRMADKVHSDSKHDQDSE